MHAKKVIKIISKLTDEQIKRFALYLKSPYLNNRSIIIELYDYIINSTDYFDEKLFSETNMKKRNLNKKFYNDKYLIKMSNFLFRELESFIIIESLQNEPLSMDLRLLRFYNSQHLDDLYCETLKRTESLLTNSPKISSIHYFINENKTNFLSKTDTRKGDLNYIYTLNSLQQFYYYNMLKIACLMLNRQLVVNYNYNSYFTNNYINPNLIQSLSNNTISLYYKLYQLLSPNNNKSKYKEILSFIGLHLSDISIEDIGIAYTILSNSSKHFFSDKNEYYNELFELYKLQIDHKTIYTNNKIRVSILKNIIALAIHKKDYDWAINFLNSHKNIIIPNELAKESYFYLFSEIHFNKKEYDLALEKLSQTKGIDNLIKFSIKRLYLKIFFEKDELNAFDSFAKSYKVFLSRDESLTHEKHEAEKRFVNNLLLINKYKLMRDKKKLHLLYEKINQENVAEKKYILSTITSVINTTT